MYIDWLFMDGEYILLISTFVKNSTTWWALSLISSLNKLDKKKWVSNIRHQAAFQCWINVYSLLTNVIETQWTYVKFIKFHFLNFNEMVNSSSSSVIYNDVCYVQIIKEYKSRKANTFTLSGGCSIWPSSKIPFLYISGYVTQVLLF